MGRVMMRSSASSSSYASSQLSSSDGLGGKTDEAGFGLFVLLLRDE